MGMDMDMVTRSEHADLVEVVEIFMFEEVIGS